MPAPKGPHDAALLELRAFGLALPGAHTKSPWPGHLDLAVNDKTFAYLSLEGDPLHMSCKLPETSEEALMLPGTKPAAYGLGKWGWVAIAFEPEDAIPVDMLREWIEESYRSQAPKALLKQLDPSAGARSAAKKVSAKKAAPKKAAPKKAAPKKAPTKKAAPKKAPAKKAPAKKR